MRPLLSIMVLVFAGCTTAVWPEAGNHPSGYFAIAAKDLSALRTSDTAGDVIRKMGSPVGEIPMPWLLYHAADHDGKYYMFLFAQKKKRLSPDDPLVSVKLTAYGDKEEPVVVWPTAK